jgi:hypothetical protein
MTTAVPQYLRSFIDELNEFGVKYKYRPRGRHLYDQIDLLNVRNHEIAYDDEMLIITTNDRTSIYDAGRRAAIDFWCLDPLDLKNAEHKGSVLRLSLLDHQRTRYVPPHQRRRPASA